MSDETWEKFISYFDKHTSVALNETERVSLKRRLAEYEFDSEMLAMADEGDIRAIFPSEWSGKKRKILLHAFTYIQGVHLNYHSSSNSFFFLTLTSYVRAPCRHLRRCFLDLQKYPVSHSVLYLLATEILCYSRFSPGGCRIEHFHWVFNFFV